MLDSMSQEKRLDFGNDKQLNQKRQLKLKTCADVYDHWRSYKRLYKKAPSDGVEFQIDYIDTGLALDEEERSRAPIALALHGAPGSYHDFSLLISHLTKQRVRVIAPNFPEYIATVKTKVLFRHSADEKAAYLRDFLKAINVKRIDLLVSHSSAIFPTLLILLNANNEALARQRQKQQQQQRDQVASPQRLDGSRAQTPKRGKAKGDQGGVVNVESFSEIGNQLRGNVVELVDKDNGTPPPPPSGARRERSAAAGCNGERDETGSGDVKAPEEDEDNENNEVFEDAIDEIDGNNNNRRKTTEGPDHLDDRQQQQVSTEEIERETADNIIESGDEPNQQNDDDGAPKGPDRNTRANGKPARRQKRAARRQLDVVVKFDEPIEIKAVALFNPAGHRLPKSMKPTWFKCGSVHVYQHKVGRSLFRKFGPAFLTVIGVPVRVDNMDNVMLSATVMRNSKCQRVVKQLEQLSQMKIPTLLVFSENDKLIEKEIFYEMTQFMRLDSKNFDVFNNDGDIELSQSRMEDWIRVMVFKAGGHYAYSNYANTVNKAVSELLSKVTSTKCSN